MGRDYPLTQMSSIEILAIGALALTIMMLVIAPLVGPRLLDYRISKRGLEFLIIRRIPVRLARLDQIVDVEIGRIAKWDYALSWRCGNGFGPIVLVRTTKRGMRRILITPADPESFRDLYRKLLVSP